MRATKKKARTQEPEKAKPGDFAGQFNSDICEMIDLALVMSDDEKQHSLDVMRGMKSARTSAVARQSRGKEA